MNKKVICSWIGGWISAVVIGSVVGILLGMLICSSIGGYEIGVSEYKELESFVDDERFMASAEGIVFKKIAKEYVYDLKISKGEHMDLKKLYSDFRKYRNGELLRGRLKKL